jgi:DNA-binding transcriptional LysR family regulator
MALTPRATYRLQLHGKFNFRDATALVPYLAALGVSHVYCSPYLRARPGSQHGYDIVDHDEINPEIGTPEDLAAHDCLIYSYLSTGNVWRFAGPGGREIPVAVSGTFRVNNGIVLAEAAAAGHGILLTPSFYVAPQLREGRLKRILAGYRLPELPIHAVYPERAKVPPKVRVFIDFLAARFGRKPDWEKF